MSERQRNYLLSYRDIEDILWEAIAKYRMDKSLPSSWIQKKIKLFKKT